MQQLKHIIFQDLLNEPRKYLYRPMFRVVLFAIELYMFEVMESPGESVMSYNF